MDRNEIAMEIVSSAANRLCLDMRFLTMAVLSLDRIVVPGTGLPSCDGRTVVFRVNSVISDYRKDQNCITRQLAHCVMHCILGHSTADARPEMLLAQDMVVEYVLDSLDTPHVSVPGRDDRLYACEKYFKKAGAPAPDLVSGILSELSGWQSNHYARMFEQDDNSAHPSADSAEWRELAQQAMAEVEGFVRKTDGTTDAFVSILRIRNRKRHDYRAFLRKFMSRRPNVLESMEEFDPIFYTYGLQNYGNIPLLDSLESSDTNRVEEFVIAIDTSGSTIRGPVVAFLEEAYAVLRQSGIGRGMNLHIIQCDETVRTDDVVRSEGDLRRLISDFKLVGGMGTDFRPVFRYVDDLIDRGDFKDLKGLMYFTDGMGTYPEKRPRYDTAFVFCDDRYMEHDVPPWAMRLVIRTGDLEGSKKEA